MWRAIYRRTRVLPLLLSLSLSFVSVPAFGIVGESDKTGGVDGILHLCRARHPFDPGYDKSREEQRPYCGTAVVFGKKCVLTASHLVYSAGKDLSKEAQLWHGAYSKLDNKTKRLVYDESVPGAKKFSGNQLVGGAPFGTYPKGAPHPKGMPEIALLELSLEPLTRLPNDERYRSRKLSGRNPRVGSSAKPSKVTFAGYGLDNHASADGVKQIRASAIFNVVNQSQAWRDALKGEPQRERLLASWFSIGGWAAESESTTTLPLVGLAPGDSGGAVITETGELVGIASLAGPHRLTGMGTEVNPRPGFGEISSIPFLVFNALSPSSENADEQKKQRDLRQLVIDTCEVAEADIPSINSLQELRAVMDTGSSDEQVETASWIESWEDWCVYNLVSHDPCVDTGSCDSAEMFESELLYSQTEQFFTCLMLPGAGPSYESTQSQPIPSPELLAELSLSPAPTPSPERTAESISSPEPAPSLEMTTESGSSPEPNPSPEATPESFSSPESTPSPEMTPGAGPFEDDTEDCTTLPAIDLSSVLPKLGDDDFFTRETAERSIRSSLLGALCRPANGSFEEKEEYHSLLDEVARMDNIGDPEVAFRLRRIFSDPKILPAVERWTKNRIQTERILRRFFEIGQTVRNQPSYSAGIPTLRDKAASLEKALYDEYRKYLAPTIQAVDISRIDSILSDHGLVRSDPLDSQFSLRRFRVHPVLNPNLLGLQLEISEQEYPPLLGDGGPDIVLRYVSATLLLRTSLRFDRDQLLPRRVRTALFLLGILQSEAIVNREFRRDIDIMSIPPSASGFPLEMTFDTLTLNPISYFVAVAPSEGSSSLLLGAKPLPQVFAELLGELQRERFLPVGGTIDWEEKLVVVAREASGRSPWRWIEMSSGQ